jgi:hypothetical protein
MESLEEYSMRMKTFATHGKEKNTIYKKLNLRGGQGYDC